MVNISSFNDFWHLHTRRFTRDNYRGAKKSLCAGVRCGQEARSSISIDRTAKSVEKKRRGGKKNECGEVFPFVFVQFEKLEK